MKLTIPRKTLLDALGVAGSSTGKDIYSKVKLIVSDNLRIEASDGDVGLVLNVACDVASPGKALVEPSKLNQILGPSSVEFVELSATDAAVVVVAGKSRFELPSQNADELPSIKADTEGDSIEVPAAALLSAIRRTKFATDQASTRYQLGGVLIEVDGEMLHLVATDGRRLSACPIDIPGGSSLGGPIVGLKGLDAICKAFAGESSLTLRATAGTLQASSERATVVAKLIDGRYPNWRSVIPADSFNHSIPVEAGPLSVALRQASVTTENVDSRGVQLAFANRSLKLSSRGQDRGKSEIELAVDTDADVAFTIDWRFALDFVANVPDDEIVEMRVNDPSKPVVLKWHGWSYVIMPMERR